MSLTAPAPVSSDLIVSYENPFAVDLPTDTVNAFTRRPHKLAKGDAVSVVHGGQMHTTTVTRVNQFEAFTANYGPWWTGQPGHRWGDCYHANGDYMIG